MLAVEGASGAASQEGERTRWRTSPADLPEELDALSLLTARAADRRGRSRCWPDACRVREQLLLVEQLQRRQRRRGHPQAGRQLPAGRHRRRLQGHHRRPDHRHQARPGAPGRRLGDAARSTTSELQAASTTGWPRRSPRTRPTSGRSGCATASSSTTARRSTADDVVYSIKRILEPRGGPVRRRRPGVDRPQADQEDGQPDGAAEAEAGRTRRSATSSASTTTASSRRATAATAAQAGRHRPLHAEELHARPAERPRAEPELLAHRRSRTSTGHHHRLRRPDRAGERAAGRPDRRHDRHPVRARSRWPSSTAA